MKKVFWYLFLPLFIILNFSGCGLAKIYNVNEDIQSKKELHLIENDILKAGESLGWDMQKHEDGYIIGLLVLRSHSAKVKIEYNETSYKINYLSSINLEYNEEENTIKSNYNGWISNLRNAINNRLFDLNFNEELQKKALQSKKDKDTSEAEIEGKVKIKDIDRVFSQKANISIVENSIIEAGNSLGWNMKLQKQGLILGRIVLRSHTATIKIDYTKDSYNISYITSENLDYTKDYTIHRNYNGWITNLSNSIDSRLDTLVV